jgi:hypothetical protein
MKMLLMPGCKWPGILLVAVGAMALAAAEPVPAPLAHWTFDEADGSICGDSSGNGNRALLTGPAGLNRIAGLFGNAISLSGNHNLNVPGGPDAAGLQKISFSAWVMPVAFDHYNEIFRKEDGDRRLLFSFQENGTILSLGLNIGGYVECDAPIKPEQVRDGRWHHCAATFDGQTMRVYLDGKEIKALARPGVIAAGGAAPGCIGSANGGECFQGTLDDLLIYNEALAPAEIVRLCESGQAAANRYREAREKRLQAVTEQLGRLNGNGLSFAATLATAKQALNEKGGIALDGSAEASLLKLLNPAFANEFNEFSRLTRRGVAGYLTSGDNAVCVAAMERLLGPMTEYLPLTEDQWKAQAPADLEKWKAVAAIQERFATLRKQGPDSRFAPAWVELVLSAAKADIVPERPRVNEAVASYVIPATPETRTLSPVEARQVLERDWLFQADGQPTPARIRNEIQWTRELAGRIKADTATELRELAALEETAGKLQQPDAGLYFQVRELKRRIMFRNPAVDFSSLLFVDMPYPAGSEWQHETRHRLGYMAVPGARLLSLNGLSPAGELKQLMPQKPLHGAFWRPDVSYDGKKVLFCFKPHNEKSFHLYEIGSDGTGLKQLTFGPYDDLDPIYLPDGEHILFSSTRSNTYVRCMPPTSAFPLARCDRDGKNIYLISQNNEPDYLPSVMNDGRVVYTRWEYTDKPLWRAQGLWTLNPDGTQVKTLWGNQSVWPDLLKDARNIPGSARIMFTGSAHHNWFSGSVGIVDPNQGYDFPKGLTKVTADVGWPESGNGPVDPVESPNYHRSGNYGAYYSPYPLGEKDFIVSANRAGKFVLYLMDVDGNRELIYEGQHNIFHAIPAKARTKPPVRPDQVEWPTRAERLNPKGGVFYSNNVYEGVPEKLKGKAKYLRILSIDAKTYTYWYMRPYLSTGPVVSGVQSEGVKRVLGTVPIRPDGSVAFRAPAGLALHFQLLDEQQRTLQTMRSFTGVMPGESRGCVGCHEQKSNAPALNTAFLAQALDSITPPPWGNDTVSYARYVRPTLDRYCASCHQGTGKGRAKVDLTPRPGFLGFDETYWLFIGRPAWGAPDNTPAKPPPGWGIADMLKVEAYDQRDPAAYQTREPMVKLSYNSRLIELVSSGKHHGVKVDEASRLRLIHWVDAMCPYLGDPEVREIADPVFQGVDWLSVRPRIKTAPHIVRPGPVD